MLEDNSGFYHILGLIFIVATGGDGTGRIKLNRLCNVIGVSPSNETSRSVLPPGSGKPYSKYHLLILALWAVVLLFCFALAVFHTQLFSGPLYLPGVMAASQTWQLAGEHF